MNTNTNMRLKNMNMNIKNMNASRIFLNRLVAEIVVIFAVTGIFKVIENRVWAGATAGAVFVALGVFVVAPALRDPGYRKRPTFAVGCVHLFFASLPLMITRLLNRGLEFQDVRVWGLPGPVFHRVSTGIYVVLILATVYDLAQTWKSKRVTTGRAGR